MVWLSTKHVQTERRLTIKLPPANSGWPRWVLLTTDERAFILQDCCSCWKSIGQSRQQQRSCTKTLFLFLSSTHNIQRQASQRHLRCAPESIHSTGGLVKHDHRDQIANLCIDAKLSLASMTSVDVVLEPPRPHLRTPGT